MTFGSPVLMAANGAMGVFIVTSVLSFSLMTLVFFGLKYLQKENTRPKKTPRKQTAREESAKNLSARLPKKSTHI